MLTYSLYERPQGTTFSSVNFMDEILCNLIQHGSIAEGILIESLGNSYTTLVVYGSPDRQSLGNFDRRTARHGWIVDVVSSAVKADRCPSVVTINACVDS